MTCEYTMKNKKGFTLIEMIISVAMVAMLITASLTILSFGQSSFVALNKQNEIQTRANQIVSTISSQVRKSARIVEIQPSYFSIDDVNGNTITYLLDPLQNALLQVDASGNIKTLSTGVKDLSFTASGRKGIQMNMELEQKGQNYRFSTTVYRRY